MAGKVSKKYFFQKEFYDIYSLETKNPGEVSVGFEWEIPCNWRLDKTDAEIDRDYYDVNLDFYSMDFVEMYHFNVHDECGGTEFASPVFYNLGQAKAMARKLVCRASKDRFLDLYNGPGECGIHVHTHHKLFLAGKSHEVLLKVFGMLNREDSSRFVWDFSRRENSEGYYCQGEALEWGTNGDEWSYVEDLWYDEGSERQMVRDNRFEKPTLEYRLWASDQELLLPAIEFSHACTKFVCGIEEKRIPYLGEMKTWLNKQKGYKILKQQPEWKWVN